MKAPVFFAILATISAWSIPAHATDTGTAIGLCELNPNCHMNDGNDSIIMTVKGTKGGRSVVVCPMPSGTCIVERNASRVDARIEAMLRGGDLEMATEAAPDAAAEVEPTN